MISQKTRNSLLYILAVVLIVFGSIFLVSLAQGYEYDFLHNRIRLTGLVLIGSQPSGANININSSQIKPKTPYRIENATTGDLELELSKNDYRDWKAHFNVMAGEVTFANYALLVPSKLNYAQIGQPNTFTHLSISEDHRHQYAVSNSPVGIWRIESNRVTPLYSPPADSSKPDQAVTEITALQTSADGSSLLFQQKTSDGKLSNMFLNTGNGQIVNVSGEFGFNLAQLYFNPANSHELYWLDGQNLRRISIDNKTVSAVLVSSVASVQPSQDRLMVVENPADPNKTEQNFYSYNLDGNDKKLVSSVVIDAAGYDLTYVKGRFNSYAAARARSKNNFYLVRDPQSDNNKATTVLTHDIRSFSFSPNSRFLAVNRAGQLKTYDLEFTQIYDNHYEVGDLKQWQWYDNYHLLLVINNQARLVDFDGQNSYAIQSPNDQASGSVPLESDKYVDYLNQSGYITRVDLVLKR